jgi:ADP-ribose pyrophosphatase YjhB (NUDIX family)
VVIFEKYHHGGQSKACVTLFKGITDQMWHDGGGGMDQHETPAVAAVRELREESCNYFNLHAGDLREYRDIVFEGRAGQLAYRAYFVDVEGVRGGRYFKNLHQLQRNGAPREWLETQEIGRFELTTLLRDGLLTTRGPLRTSLVGGTPATILGRTKACVRELYKFRNETGVENALPLKEFKIEDGSHLNGTICVSKAPVYESIDENRR